MTELRPLTVTITYEWDRTRFELLDARSQVLALFEDKGLLLGFRAQQDELSVVAKGGKDIYIGINRVQIYELAVGGEPSDIPASTQLAAEIGSVLGVSGVVPRMAFQHLVPWDQDDQLNDLQQAVDVVVPESGKLGAVDFALLMDGHREGKWHYQAEFGVVRDYEASDRFARRVGRSNAFIPDGRLLSGLTKEDFSPLSTFVDSSWHLPDLLPVPFDEAQELVDEAQKLASEVVGTLHAYLSKDL